MNRDGEAFKRFVRDVCLEVRARELHREIRQEMTSHLEALAEEKEADGCPAEEAEAWAVRQMGDPLQLGRELNRVHKPRFHWGMLAGAFCLLAAGFLAMLSADSSYAQWRAISTTGFFENKVLSTVAGLILAVFLILFDYRKLQRYSWPIYITTVTLIIGTLMFGGTINGSPYLRIGSWSFDIIGMSPYAFLIVSVGSMSGLHETHFKSILWRTLLFVALPAFLYLKWPSLFSLTAYLCMYFTLQCVLYRRWRETAGQVLVLASAAVFCMERNHYLQQRLGGYFAYVTGNAGAVSPDVNYQVIQMNLAIRAGGWWGNGFASVIDRLPEFHAETVYAYWIYSFGWWSGLALAGAVIALVSSMAGAARKVREDYGRRLMLVCSGLLGIQFVWCIGMTFGLLPITGTSFPFVSAGGSHQLLELAVVGLVFGIYRRKDMIRVGV